MLRSLRCLVAARLRLGSYQPQPVTFTTLGRWLRQFTWSERLALLRLLGAVEFISEGKLRGILQELNANLLHRLVASGIPPKRVMYVSIDAAGSSSPAILNLLRDCCRLETQGCQFLDSKDARGISDTTNRLGEGAIIYVDDFIGTGSQFCKSRDFASDYVVGNFSEFLLAPCICEESLDSLKERGVEPITKILDRKEKRPLHEFGSSWDPKQKQLLLDICGRVNEKHGLGFRGLATMVVLYRNAPNTTPAVLRGSMKQKPFCGILPRTTDFPKVNFSESKLR